MQCEDCKHVFADGERWHRVSRPSGIKALCTPCWVRPRSVFDAINEQIDRERSYTEFGQTPKEQAFARTAKRRRRRK